MTIAKYIASMKTEVNLSDHYRRDLIAVLYRLSIYISSKRNKAESFRLMTRKDIIAFLDSFRKPDSSDPLHLMGKQHVLGLIIDTVKTDRHFVSNHEMFGTLIKGAGLEKIKKTIISTSQQKNGDNN